MSKNELARVPVIGWWLTRRRDQAAHIEQDCAAFAAWAAEIRSLDIDPGLASLVNR